MNKLIYAIGIAVAATFTTSVKHTNHTVEHKTEHIEKVTGNPAIDALDTLAVSNEVKLP